MGGVATHRDGAAVVDVDLETARSDANTAIGAMRDRGCHGSRMVTGAGVRRKGPGDLGHQRFQSGDPTTMICGYGHTRSSRGAQQGTGSWVAAAGQ